MSRHYPPVTSAMLTPFRAIDIQLNQDPGFLDYDDCPYDGPTKALLRRLASGGSGGGDLDPGELRKALQLTEEGGKALDLEIAKLYQTVQRDAATYTGSDTKDKMSLMRTANDLLTKLVDLQRSRANIRQFARATRVMIETMEEYLTPAQRTEYITKMEGQIDE